MKKKNNSRWILIAIMALFGAIGLVVISAAASVLVYRQLVGEEDAQVGAILDQLQVQAGQEGAGQGVLILRVDPGSPAEQAGLSPRSVILSVNGRSVNSPSELKDVIAEFKVGDTITLTVKRGENTEDIAVTLGDSGPYLGVNVGLADGDFHLFGEGFDDLEGFGVPGSPGHPRLPGGPDLPEGMMPFEFYFDEFDFDRFDDEHGYFFDLLGESALIMSVEEDSPAAEAGLLAGDAILEANGQAVHDSQELIDLVANLSPGEVLSLQVQRGDENVSLDVTLASHPNDADRAYLGVFLAPGGIPEELEFFQDQRNS